MLTELTERRHAVSVVQLATARCLMRTVHACAGRSDQTLRNEPESWPTDPVAAADARVLAAARPVTYSREDPIGAQLAVRERGLNQGNNSEQASLRHHAEFGR